MTDGDVSMEAPEPAARAEPFWYAKFQRNGDWYVIPDSAARLGAAGTFDLEAFNVSGLVRRRSGGANPLPVKNADQESERYELTVRLLDRNGAAAGEGSGTLLVGIDNQTIAPVGAEGRISVPPGRYALYSYIVTPRASQEPTYATIMHPDLRVTADTTTTLDARIGRRASVTIDDPAARGGLSLIYGLTKMDGQSEPLLWASGFDPRFHEVYAASVAGATSDRFAFAQRESRREPEVELFTTGANGFEVNATWFDTSPEPELRTKLTAVHGGQGRPEDLAGIDATGKLVLIELPGTLTNEEAYERIRNVQAAGAKVGMVVTDRPQTLSTASSKASSKASSTAPFTVPTLFSRKASAVKLADAVRRGAVSVSLTTHPVADHRYELAFTAEARVPARLQQRARTKELATVQNAYHGSGSRYVQAALRFFGGALDHRWTFRMRAGVSGTEHFTPGTWSQSTHGDHGALDYLFAPDITLRAGKTTNVSWNKAVTGPGLLGDGPWAVRDGNTIQTSLPLYADGAGHPRWPSSRSGDVDKGSQTLYRDGQLVSSSEVADTGTFDVPADTARYQLVCDIARTADWWPLSTKVNAAWTFRSSAADNGKPLPLLTVRFAPDVDLNNAAPANRAFTIPVEVERQTGSAPARVTSLTVEASYDDGATWQPAPVIGRTVRVQHPAARYVSLRAKAADAGDNQVELTIIRAYQLR
ncbi:hypothetical protein [Nonomuraea sp. NPDC049400]|uniref:hypothetical protein n=1 Tax=Nonomuraea sp. NPDC049400 TaxID=3364352 RepID=UPI00378F3461